MALCGDAAPEAVAKLYAPDASSDVGVWSEVCIDV